MIARDALRHEFALCIRDGHGSQPLLQRRALHNARLGRDAHEQRLGTVKVRRSYRRSDRLVPDDSSGTDLLRPKRAAQAEQQDAPPKSPDYRSRSTRRHRRSWPPPESGAQVAVVSSQPSAAAQSRQRSFALRTPANGLTWRNARARSESAVRKATISGSGRSRTRLQPSA
jgi:hypothetical protein